MTKKKAGAKAERKHYSPEFKRQAVLRAVKDGVPLAAGGLGLEPACVISNHRASRVSIR